MTETAISDTQLYALSEKLIKLATKTGQTLAIAESCTGGFIAKCLTDVPGASSVFQGAVIAYDNEVKLEKLNVPSELLDSYGAVSQQVADHMAENCRYVFAADIAISTTGIAGPGGGSAQKPIGLVYMSVAGKPKVGQPPILESYVYEFGDKTRDEIRRYCVLEALKLLNDALG